MAYTFELNNARKDDNFVSGQITSKSPVVEIFSAMVEGKDVAQFGAKADKAVNYIKELNSKASMGDFSAAAELNSIRRFAIEPKLLQELKLLSIFGDYTPLGYDESAEIEVYDFAGIRAERQASGQDVPFATPRKKRVPITTQTISGGYAIDYRRAALGDMTRENEGMEQTRIAIRNNAIAYIYKTIYDTIKNTTGVKYHFEDAGLTKANLDSLLAKVRRIGKPAITGDYALVSQINAFLGYSGTTPAVTGISQKAMDEINSTGLIGMYNGSVITELPNGYEYTKLNAKGDNFETILPTGVGFVTPTGGTYGSAIKSVTRGGLTSFTGNDVTTGTIMTRFDLEVGTKVVPGREHEIAMFADKNLTLFA